MKFAGSRFIKPFIIVISLLITIVVVSVILISPITKYLVEKYDEKYTGRKITMDWVYVNPFTGYVHISNLKIYESRNLPGGDKGDSIFFSAKGVTVNFAMLKLLSKTIEISELTLDQPKGIIIQNNQDFNFNDLIKLITPEKPRTTPSRFHFNILTTKIIDGEFYYREKQIPIYYFVKKVNFESSGKRWDADTVGAQFSLSSGIGTGNMKGNFTINFKKNEYRFDVVVHKFDLNILEQYLKDLTNYGSFSANIDANVKASGGFDDEENVMQIYEIKHRQGTYHD